MEVIIYIILFFLTFFEYIFFLVILVDQLDLLPRTLNKALVSLGSSVYKTPAVKAVQQSLLTELHNFYPDCFGPPDIKFKETKIDQVEQVKKKRKIEEEATEIIKEKKSVSTEQILPQESLSKEEKVSYSFV